jgi:ribosomal protein S18 acetylase RimI-like enzyme
MEEPRGDYPENPKICIRPVAPAEAPQIAEMVRRSFLECVAHTYRPRGVRCFLRANSPRGMLRRLRRGQTLLAAFGVPPAAATHRDLQSTGESILGLVVARKGNHISLLFVEPAVHRRGVGRRLFEAALADMRQREPRLHCVTLNSSEWALPFYRALGFQAVGSPGYKRGMKVTPMRKPLA